MKSSFPVRSLLFAMLAMLGLAAQTLAQPQPGGPPGGFGGGFGGPGGLGSGGIIGLAMREEVQQELQLVDEQRDKVRDLMEEARDRVREEIGPMFADFRDMSDEERREAFDKIRKKGEEMNAELEKDLGKVLLPHQMERLKQIDMQAKVRNSGAGDIAKALNLSDEQREKLEARIAEVREEMRAKIRELEAEAREKMLDVLTTEQRDQLKKLMGDQFEMRDQGPGFGGRFGGGFGRGQDGQGRGGRNRGENRPEGGRPPRDN
jgi:Spy/CpxP family protein refolding chaperone